MVKCFSAATGASSALSPVTVPSECFIDTTMKYLLKQRHWSLNKQTNILLICVWIYAMYDGYKCQSSKYQ